MKIPYVSFEQMITGFNTDVPHEGRVYHVQTEDGGSGNPFLESLIYVGGTIVAKKLTPYTMQMNEGADQEAIASLLRRQHQVIIAAIKAGRIQDLIRHTQKQQHADDLQEKIKVPRIDLHEKAQVPSIDSHENALVPRVDLQEKVKPLEVDVAHPDVNSGLIGAIRDPEPADSPKLGHASTTAPVPVYPLVSMDKPNRPAKRVSGGLKVKTLPGPAHSDSGSLNFDQVIADYLKRGSGQARLDVRVLAPEVFIAGNSIVLKVQVTHESKPHFDATVTVKIIGTAFKPQVFIGRVGRDGVATFSLTLPAFTAGTAAIVIEAQSGTGRGELKNLIRRS